MDASKNKRWLKAVILFGIVYLVVGIAFAELAKLSSSNETGAMWRRAAWLVSAAAFVIHIGYEHFRQRNSSRSIAFHASGAAALGAFGLAVAANVHALWVGAGNQGLLTIALVAWPALTAVPAFVVALIVANLLARMRSKV
jgi:vacuolar-type H+-ATPase subunit I/STV1